MFKHALAAAFTASLVAAPAVSQDAGEDFAALVEDFEAYEDESDLAAQARDGDLDAAASWPDISPAAQANAAMREAEFLERLEAIDAGALNEDDAVSFAVLDYILRYRVERADFAEWRIPFNSDSGFYSGPTYVAASTRPRNIDQAEAWVRRVEAIPAYFEAQTDWMRQGLADGFTQPRVIVDNAINQVESLTDEAALTAILVQPIDALPSGVAEAERERLRAETEAAVRDHALPAYRDLLAFFEEEYRPGSRDSLGISEVPDGREYYRTLVRYHTTLDTSPEEVHARGLAEVARIRAEMDEVIAESGFEGSFEEFIDFLRTDEQFYADSPEELLMRAAWIAKQLDDQMPRFFGRLPRLSYGVRPVPDSMAPTYTTGRYWGGDLENGVAGGYMVNTYALDQRPLYNLPALTAHEGVPGHHHQISLAQEMDDLPDFRRQTYITAFGEGWGLYTENLAIDMGIYTTPYEDFGRLTYEMWRACRLVMDTGIHYYGWTQAEAEACLLENSALAPHNVRTETLRYIGWPGQALAYKSGELLMRDLRARAEDALGEDFDIRAFHDAMLENGAMPLDALDAHMSGWIADQVAALDTDE